MGIADLNGDGSPDLATANNHDNTVSVLLNRGDGSFEAAREYRTGSGPYSVAIGDLNGDGKPDLVTANGESNRVSVLVNQGAASFPAHVEYRTGSEPYSVAIGDLNGDGRLDLVAANDGPDEDGRPFPCFSTEATAVSGPSATIGQDATLDRLRSAT